MVRNWRQNNKHHRWSSSFPFGPGTFCGQTCCCYRTNILISAGTAKSLLWLFNYNLLLFELICFILLDPHSEEPSAPKLLMWNLLWQEHRFFFLFFHGHYTDIIHSVTRFLLAFVSVVVESDGNRACVSHLPFFSASGRDSISGFFFHWSKNESEEWEVID